MTPTDLVERVMALGPVRLAESLELLHPDAVWIHDTDRPPLHGHDESGDVVVVYGQLRIPRTEGKRFVELRQIAWVHEIAGDRMRA